MQGKYLLARMGMQSMTTSELRNGLHAERRVCNRMAKYTMYDLACAVVHARLDGPTPKFEQTRSWEYLGRKKAASRRGPGALEHPPILLSVLCPEGTICREKWASGEGEGGGGSTRMGRGSAPESKIKQNSGDDEGDGECGPPVPAVSVGRDRARL